MKKYPWEIHFLPTKKKLGNNAWIIKLFLIVIHLQHQKWCHLHIFTQV